MPLSVPTDDWKRSMLALALGSHCTVLCSPLLFSVIVVEATVNTAVAAVVVAAVRRQYAKLSKSSGYDYDYGHFSFLLPT